MRGRKTSTEEVLALARRAAEIREDVRFLLRADDPAFVYFLEIRGRGVTSAPLPSTCPTSFVRCCSSA